MWFNKFVMSSLKRGMLLSVSVPLLIAVAVSTFLLVVELQQYRKAGQAAEMKDMMGSMSTLIHEQQKERGATSVFLSSKGEQFGAELLEQRARTDKAAAEFLASYELHGEAGGVVLSTSLSKVVELLQSRQGVRNLVDQLEIATPEALGHYTKHNSMMLSSIASIGSLAESPRLALKVASLEALLAAKEFSGIERAIGSGGFAAGRFDFSRAMLLDRLITRQGDNLARYNTFAEDKFRAEVDAIAALEATNDLSRMRSIAFSSTETNDLAGVAASDFFAAATVRIDAFKEVEDRLVASIAVTAEEIARNSFNIVVALVMGMLVAAGASFSTTRYVIRNMLKAVRRISDAADRLAKGDETAELPKDNPKELGRIVWSINFFKESVSEAKQREAEERAIKQQADEEARNEEQRRKDEEKLRVEQEAAEARLEQERMSEYATEISSVVAACAEGDFSSKIGLEGKDGIFREIGEGLNALVQSVDNGLTATGETLERVATGDLSTRVEGEFKGAFAHLQRDTNAMIKALRDLVVDINTSATNLSSSSSELLDTSDSLSKQAEQNAASLEQTSVALVEMSERVSQVNENVSEANKNAKVAKDTAERSAAVADEAVQAMNEISEASKEIASVVTAIDDISFQINLLALNAGVEAARAGDAGRGFSVVASEVRELAQRAGDAAKEIDTVIGKCDMAVSEGVSKVQNAQQSFKQISDSVVGVSDRIERVSEAISEQVTGISEITGAVGQIDRNTQRQAASFEEVTATSGLLSGEATGLKMSTSRFKTDGSSSSAEIAA